MRRLLFAAVLACAARPAAAGDVEVTGQVGASLPFYSQSFRVDPNTWVPAGVPVSASGAFGLDASGGLSAAGGVAWFFSKSLGLEARVDSAGVDLEVTGGDVTAGGGGLPPALGLGVAIGGEAQLDRLTAFSLNLRLRSTGRVRVFASAGLSYLPATGAEAAVRLEAQLRLPGLPPVSLPALGVSARGNLASAVGGNVGVGVDLALSRQAALVVEGRGFLFPSRQLEWGPSGGGSSPLETALAAALEPIDLRPGFFQLTGGLALRF